MLWCLHSDELQKIKLHFSGCPVLVILEKSSVANLDIVCLKILVCLIFKTNYRTVCDLPLSKVVHLQLECT